MNSRQLSYGANARLVHFRTNLLVAAGMLGYQGTLASLFGQLHYAGCWLLLVLTALGLRHYAHLLPAVYRDLLGACASLGYCLFGPFLLPDGGPALTFYFVTALTVFSMVGNARRAYIGFSILTVLVFALTQSAWVPHVPHFAPDVFFVGPMMLVAMCSVAWQTYLARLRYNRLAIEIVDAEAKALDAEQRANRQQAKLVRSTAQYRTENDRLAHQVAREAKLTAKLVERRNDQRALVQAIHHDLREPLRSIVSFTQLIRRRLGTCPEGAAVHEYLSFAEDGGQRMARMLSDLLSYTREEATEEAPQRLELDQILNDVKRNLQALFEQRGAQLDVGSLPAVFGYETQLLQLFQNLIANAVKFTPADRAPHIRIYQELDENGVLAIFIADNGIGIPQDRLASVFGLFNRAHEHESFEGSGVGLALCRRIATAHDAALTVSSTVGVGTTFRLVFSEHAPLEDAAVGVDKQKLV